MAAEQTPESDVRLEILGGFALWVGGRIHRLRTRRTEDLFCFLALHPRFHSRSELADRFWPQDLAEVSRQKLRMALTSIRSVVGDRLESDREQVRLLDIPIDAREAMQSPERFPHTPEPLATLDKDWAMAFRQEFSLAVAARLRERAEEADHRGQVSEAVQLRYRILDVEPMSLSDHRRLLKSLQELGRTADIRRHLETWDHLPPEWATLLGEPEARPNPLVLPNNLFVGREIELEAITASMLGAAEPQRMTFVGAPGIGKTRLAQEVLRRAPEAEILPVFVPLAGCSNRQAMVDLIRLALGLEAADDDLELSETAILDQPATLVVLDNLEHLIDKGAGEIVKRMTPVGSALRVIATSQRPLGYDGEEIWTVKPLPASRNSQVPSPRERLFLSRARDYLADGDLSGRRHQLVIDICSRLDGLPLAIELAARALDRVSLEHLAEEKFPSTVESPSNERTMASAIRWSVGLLEAPVREALKKATIFQGSFSRAAFFAVIGESAESILEELVDRSLLARALDLGPGRFRMLEPVRHVLFEEPSAESEEAFSRHFADGVIRFGATGEATEKRALIPDLAHLELAFDYLIRSGNTDLAAQMTTGLAILWASERSAPHGEAALESLYQSLSGGDDLLRSRVANARGYLAFFRREPEIARVWYGHRLEAIRSLEDPLLLASAECNLGLAAAEMGDYASALEFYRDALPILEEKGLPRQAVTAKINLSGAYLGLSRFDEARETVQGAVDACIEVETLRPWLGVATFRVAEVEFGEGRHEGADVWAMRAWEISQGLHEHLRAVEAASMAAWARILKGEILMAREAMKLILAGLESRPLAASLSLATRAGAALAAASKEWGLAWQLLGVGDRWQGRQRAVKFPPIAEQEEAFFRGALGGLKDRGDRAVGRTLSTSDILSRLERLSTHGA